MSPDPELETSFACALDEIIRGSASGIRRRSWPSGMTIHLQKPDEHSKMGKPYLYMREWKEGVPAVNVPWEPGHASIFANDWEIERNFSN